MNGVPPSNVHQTCADPETGRFELFAQGYCAPSPGRVEERPARASHRRRDDAGNGGDAPRARRRRRGPPEEADVLS